MRLSALVVLVQLCFASRSKEDHDSSDELQWYANRFAGPRRPPHHHRPQYRPQFYSGEEYQSGYKPAQSRRDPYEDPYAYAKHLVELTKQLNRNDRRRGNWHQIDDDHKSKEHQQEPPHSKESTSSSYENGRPKYRQNSRSHEDEYSHEAYKAEIEDKEESKASYAKSKLENENLKKEYHRPGKEVDEERVQSEPYYPSSSKHQYDKPNLSTSTSMPYASFSTSVQQAKYVERLDNTTSQNQNN